MTWRAYRKNVARRWNQFVWSTDWHTLEELHQEGVAWWKDYGFRSLKDVARVWEDFAGWVIDPGRNAFFFPWKSRWLKLPKGWKLRNATRRYRMNDTEMAHMERLLHKGLAPIYFDEIFPRTPMQKTIQRIVDRHAERGDFGVSWPRPSSVGLRRRTRRRIEHKMKRPKSKKPARKPPARIRAARPPHRHRKKVAAKKVAAKANPDLLVVENPSVVGAVVFQKKTFTRAKAKAWAKRHGFRYGTVRETKTSYRLEQKPAVGKGTRWRYKRVAAGVSLLLAFNAAAPASGSFGGHQRKKSFQRAMKMYRSLHGTTPMKLETVEVPAGTPKYLIMLGRADKISYVPSNRSELADKKSGKTVYTHRFGPGVRVATDPNGRYLVVADTKGKMRVSLAGRKVGIIG